LSGRRPVAYTIEGEGIRLDIALVETEKLLVHEETIPEALEWMIGSLDGEGVQKSPVIVDRETLVVLDGMHRVTALRSLGCRLTCVCLVDYMDPRIRVDRWCRVVPQSISLGTLEERFRGLGLTKLKHGSEWGEGARILLMLEDGYYEMLASGSEVLPAFEAVASIEAWLREMGLEVTYETERDAEEKHERGELGFVVCPPKIDKNHVIETARAGRVFTFKATRHIVPARPMGADVPLEMLRDTESSLEDANRALSEILNGKSLTRFEPGRIWGKRRYEEAVYLFEDT